MGQVANGAVAVGRWDRRAQLLRSVGENGRSIGVAHAEMRVCEPGGVERGLTHAAKLSAHDIVIDELTAGQREYLTSWQFGT
ncbi:hypothetical protein [Saccharopolyspora spinosa]|uniref:hypothetical protein n=1 Tax=Saccharopolyspora spinosa TaxID=60894 RepID=UPI000237B0A8|nr:hypothetical protein [Saccharopolyspora spinosa]